MSGPRRDADVLVVGAGPAGASAARRLALAGVDVLLLDASSFPRSKPCGDCLSPGVTPLLEELGVLDRVERRGTGRLAGWRIRTPGGVWFGGRFGTDGDGGTPPRGLSLPRRELDDALAAAAVEAGARLRERVRVYGLLREDGRIAGVRARDAGGEPVELRARTVVGADGLRSTVARRIEGVRRGPRHRLAVVGRFAGVSPPAPGSGASGRAVEGGAAFGEMRLSREGMLGMAPTGRGRWNVTLVLPRDRAPALAPDPSPFFRRRLEAYGVADRFRSARGIGELEVTGPFESTPRRLSAPGALLAGDAAGYFDPLTGQGVHRALATGRSAAAAARAILRADGPAAAEATRRRHAARLHRLLEPGRRVQRLVDEVVVRPGVIEAAGRLLAARPGLAALLLDVTGDRLPASALADPRRLARAWSARPASSRRSG